MSLYDDLVRENAALRKRVEEQQGRVEQLEFALRDEGVWKARATGAERENAVLRKRVEELEISAGSASMTIRLAQERAEKAERERDELMENHQALGREYEAQGRVADKLQADLDAALLVVQGVATELRLLCLGHRFQKETAENWAKQLEALLEKRRERRG